MKKPPKSFFAKWTNLIGLFTISMFLPQIGNAAFGISPPFLNADHLVAGAAYSQTIYLVQDKPEQDLQIKAKLDISDRVRTWITIDKGFDFVIGKGVRQFPVTITIKVPKDSGNVAYSGTINFVTAPPSAGQVTIALGVQVAINLIVGKDIYRRFSVPVVKVLDVEEGWNPRVYVKFNNEGNVPESFNAATFELIDKYGGATLAYTQKQKDFPETPPFTVKEYTIEFPIDFHLGLGQYWGSVNFLQSDKVVANQRGVFQVLERGSLSTPLEKIFNSIKDSWQYYSIAILIIIAISFFSLRRKKVVKL